MDDEKLKNKVLIGLSVLCVILLVSAFKSCSDAALQKRKWRNEMDQRLTSEERASKVQQDQTVLEQKLKQTQDALQQNARELDAAKKALLQEQMVNQNLKSEIDKLNKLKEALESDLKEALVSGGKTARQAQPKK
ncbi:MAG: hypothetical protein ACM3OC_07330 [Deltaproteobacteria bacterium]